MQNLERNNFFPKCAFILPSYNNDNNYYVSICTRAVIGQFCGPYSTVGPAKFEGFLSPAPD